MFVLVRVAYMFVLVSRNRTLYLNLFIFYPILIIILYDFIWVCELELFYFLKIFVVVVKRVLPMVKYLFKKRNE